MQRKRDRDRNPGPGRPRKDGKARAAQGRPAVTPATPAPPVKPLPVPKTPQAAQDLLARIGAGRLPYDPGQVAALKAFIDSCRRDGTAFDEESSPEWLKEDARLSLLIAEQQHRDGVESRVS